MNRAIALEWLGLSSHDFGPCYGSDFSHQEFAAAWRGNVPCPTEAELVAATAPPLTYKQLRVAAYPPIGDQLDAIWKGGEAEAAMRETILAVKAEYPKP